MATKIRVPVLRPSHSLLGALVATTIVVTVALCWAGWRLLDQGLASFVRDRPENMSSAFMVASVSGGVPRVLFETAGAFSLNGQWWQWTPDSHGVVEKGGFNESGEFWHLPLTGPARKLDIDGRQWGEGFQVHPEGGQIAFAAQAGEPGAEVWALEDLLPSRSSTR